MRVRTEVQVACPCDNLIEQRREQGADPHVWVERTCVDCGATEVGRYIRIPTRYPRRGEEG
jgi:hypothetical protein